MRNPFLSDKDYDTETAMMLERAYILDIGDSVAYTDGSRVFVNTPENLYKLLPAYNDGMLKWILWHEEMHKQLKHHNRFFKYVDELDREETEKEFSLTKQEVNIIMDILVHDWMSKKFPELVPTARENLTQFRDENMLKYNFTTFTLEEMLKEYADYKKETGDASSEPEKTSESKEEDTSSEPEKTSESKEDTSESKEDTSESKEEDTSESKEEDTSESKEDTSEGNETVPNDGGTGEVEPDWSKLDKINPKEFISKTEGDSYEQEVKRLKDEIARLTQLTKTLNGLITSKRVRSYRSPSSIMTGQNTILKGSNHSKASLFLCFDASGSMSREMNTFKKIISEAIPQAMNTPTRWFSGCPANEKGVDIIKNCRDTKGKNRDYYRGKYKDFMEIEPGNGYEDDGDRTIELCWEVEQEGYSPIGITDGGGQLSWSKKQLKQLKRTILVSRAKDWIDEVKSVNPQIKVIHI